MFVAELVQSETTGLNLELEKLKGKESKRKGNLNIYWIFIKLLLCQCVTLENHT